MEHIILDNVRERGSDRVYRLVCATEGLYALHVTDSDGQNDYTGGSVESHTNSPETAQHMENMFAGEEQLSEQFSSAVSEQVHSRFYAWNGIDDIKFTSGDNRTMTLDADGDHYEFTFPNTPPERVEAFAGKVMSTLETEKAGQREMNR